jgi:hypothetical protein
MTPARSRLGPVILSPEQARPLAEPTRSELIRLLAQGPGFVVEVSSCP